MHKPSPSLILPLSLDISKEDIMSAYFVVNHISDENKTEGLVESYQMVPVQVQGDDGEVRQSFKRLNFVHWPQLPVPFVHMEWDDDLKFENIYTPETDNGNEELSEIQDRAQEVFAELTEEQWHALPESVKDLISLALPSEYDDGEDDETDEAEEEEFETEEEWEGEEAQE
jgi:hypothetical protein